MKKHEDLSGREFGHWLVIRPKMFDDQPKLYWICLCRSCKNLYYVREDNLLSGRSTKCACCGLGWMNHRRKVKEEDE